MPGTPLHHGVKIMPGRAARERDCDSGRMRTGALALLAVLTACSSAVPGRGTASLPPSPASSSPPPSPTPSAPTTSTAPKPPTPTLSQAQRVLATMDEAHRVGQLFMVDGDATLVDAGAVALITNYHVGGVYLSGQTSLSVRQTAAVTAGLQQHAAGPKLFISSDQEGGQVQRFTGPGFSQIPSGVQQGLLAPAELRADAQLWGGQLAGAGVNLDLAPVADTVPSAAAAQHNPPIGGYDREYGYDPATVASHAVAFAAGLAAAGVDTTAKHFPGLGRVTANTDTTAGVTDTLTTRSDPYLRPFAALVRAGVPFVMMSTAVYMQLDPARPAAFSPTIVDGMLRGELGFRGVVISDDLNAVQVRAVPAAERAVDFIAAGGDIVLDVQNADIAPMIEAVLARARTDPAFRAQVDAAALRVLTAKQARGLLG